MPFYKVRRAKLIYAKESGKQEWKMGNRQRNANYTKKVDCMGLIEISSTDIARVHVRNLVHKLRITTINWVAF